MQAVETQHGLPLESLERLNPLALEKSAGPPVSKTYNHFVCMLYVQRTIIKLKIIGSDREFLTTVFSE